MSHRKFLYRVFAGREWNRRRPRGTRPPGNWRAADTGVRGAASEAGHSSRR